MATIVPEFITLLRSIRDILYPQMVTMHSGFMRFDNKLGTNINSIITVGNYDVNTGLPDSKVLGVLEVRGYTNAGVIGTKIYQKYIDTASGNKYVRTSANGLGTDWTAFVATLA